MKVERAIEIIKMIKSKNNIEFAYNVLLRKIVEKVFRKYISPPIVFYSTIANTFTDPNEILKTVNLTASDFSFLAEEYKKVRSSLEERYKEVKLSYPANFAIAEGSSYLIYSLIRIFKPDIVVESGVANGHSTFIMLNALKINGKGKLISIDISSNVGVLLREEDKENWELRILKGDFKKAFKENINSIPKIDVFLHDSNHLYYWQIYEYETVKPKLRKGSILMSDDVDFSYAFFDFCKKINKKPLILLEPQKAFGILMID